MHEEFANQLLRLLSIGYPTAIGITEKAFVKKIEPLENTLPNIITTHVDYETGVLPFVIVISHSLLNTSTAMKLIRFNNKNAVTKLYPLNPEDFLPISSVNISTTDTYILYNIDRGNDTRNVRPEDALISIQSNNRSPLLIDEGVAILTQYPEFLKKNYCFSLLGSRHSGDQRVPALWINGNKQANLGWCWDRNPHTWLGSASCEKRFF